MYDHTRNEVRGWLAADDTAPEPLRATGRPSSPAHRHASVRRTSALVLLNGQASRAGDADRFLDPVLDELRRSGLRAHALVTATERELHDALDFARDRRAVLIGGDGTVHAAVNAGISPLELGLIPIGRANNIARALGIPVDPRRAARVAAGSRVRPVDLLRVESATRELYGVEALSAGFQAEARGDYHAENSGDLRAGAWALAGALRRYHEYDVDLRLDGVLAYAGSAAQVFLSNLPFFGFGFRVDPLARLADGHLEAVVAKAGSRRELAALLLAAYRGDHLRRPGVTLRRARSATLATELPLVCDSEVLPPGPVVVAVSQGRLRMAA